MNIQMWTAYLASGFYSAQETPSPRPSIDPNDVSPGIESFVIAFILALSLLFLLWSMSRHLRKVQVRAKLNAERAAREKNASEPVGQEHGSEPVGQPGQDGDPGSN